MLNTIYFENKYTVSWACLGKYKLQLSILKCELSRAQAILFRSLELLISSLLSYLIEPQRPKQLPVMLALFSMFIVFVIKIKALIKMSIQKRSRIRYSVKSMAEKTLEVTQICLMFNQIFLFLIVNLSVSVPHACLCKNVHSDAETIEILNLYFKIDNSYMSTKRDRFSVYTLFFFFNFSLVINSSNVGLTKGLKCHYLLLCNSDYEICK